MENVATMLAWYEMYGDYKIFLDWADQLEKVKPEQVQSIAQETFARKKATTGILTRENAKWKV